MGGDLYVGSLFMLISTQILIFLLLLYSVCFGCDQLVLLTSDFIELLNLSLWTKLSLLLQAMMKSPFFIYVSSLTLLSLPVHTVKLLDGTMCCPLHFVCVWFSIHFLFD